MKNDESDDKPCPPDLFCEDDRSNYTTEEDDDVEDRDSKSGIECGVVHWTPKTIAKAGHVSNVGWRIHKCGDSQVSDSIHYLE